MNNPTTPRTTAKGSDRVNLENRLMQEAEAATNRANKQKAKALKLIDAAAKAKMKREAKEAKREDKNVVITRVVSKDTINDINKELTKILNVLNKKHKLDIGITDIHVSTRGNIQIVIKGKSNHTEERRVNPRRTDETNAAYRFRINARAIGLKKGLLHKIVTFKGKTFTLEGLKGKGNKIVLVGAEDKINLVNKEEFVEGFSLVRAPSKTH